MLLFFDNKENSGNEFNFNEMPKNQPDSMFSINIPNDRFNRNSQIRNAHRLGQRHRFDFPLDPDEIEQLNDEELDREIRADLNYQTLRSIIEEENRNMDAIIENVINASDSLGSVHALNKEGRPKPKLKKEEMIKKHYIKNDKGGLEQPTCCICLNNIKIKDMITKLSCNHVFHYKCLSKWCEVKTECPFCRETIK